MPDKTANWGVPGSGARYRTQDSDPSGGGNFVVAERLDSNGDPVDVLLEWDETAGEWVSGGPVNLDGGDVTNVGALDANSVSTDGLQSETDILEIGSAGGLLNRREIGSSQTPIQDALDSVRADGGGMVLLPPVQIDHPGPIVMPSRVELRGVGGGKSGLSGDNFGTQIRITNDDTEPAIDIGTNDPRGFHLDKITILGTGLGSNSPTTAITGAPGSGSPSSWTFGDIYVNEWRGSVLDLGDSFQLRGGALIAGARVDAGDQIATFILNTSPDNQIQEIVTYAGSTNSTTGNANDVFNVGGGNSQMSIGHVNIGGAAGKIVVQGGARSWDLIIGNINYEPSEPESTAFNLFDLHTNGRLVLDALRVNGSFGEVDINHAYRINKSGCENIEIPTPNFVYGAAVNNTIFEVNAEPGGPVRYKGVLADVDNTSGVTLTSPNTVFAYDGNLS